MKVFHTINLDDELSNGSVAIGNFDGVHLGHQRLIAHALSLKGQHHAGVLTFSPHPHQLLRPAEPHFSLTSDQEKIAQFERLGLDVAVVLDIDKQFLELSAEEFIRRVLRNALKVKHVVVGEDFTFGKAARGDVTSLKNLCAEHNIAVHVIDAVKCGSTRCSSTAIRAYLRAGAVDEARAMLGRSFSVIGRVVSGQGLGKEFGFATANLMPAPGFSLALGIYASVVRVDNDEFIAATSVGVRPTVCDDNVVVIEAYCLDASPDLRGREIEVFFIERLRDEIKFPTITALQEQVQKDVHHVRHIHRRHPSLFHGPGLRGRSAAPENLR